MVHSDLRTSSQPARFTDRLAEFTQYSSCKPNNAERGWFEIRKCTFDYYSAAAFADFMDDLI